MAKNNNLTDFLTDIADAIRAKKGTTAKINPQNFASEIASISTGGGDTPTPDMPVIGDGKTYLYIKIATKGRMVVPLYFSQTVANGVTINWGDGSASQTLSGTGNKNTTHTYASIGDYVISLKVNSGTLGLGYGSSSYCVMGSTSNNGRVYCNMLQAVEIGNSVTSIGNYAFSNCYGLASVVIPNSVTSINDYAFSNCYGLASVVIPNSVTSIGGSAFTNCYSLASVVIPNSVTSIGNYAFRYCYGLASVVIPNSVTSIGSSVFAYCYGLASVVISNGVTSINDSVFANCYGLASVVISNGVTSINNSFSNCYGLVSVVIPKSVASISGGAFYGCSGMAFCDFRQHTSVPTLATTSAFSNIPSDCKIVVPDSLYNTWRSATNWSTYASKIVKASGFKI